MRKCAQVVNSWRQSGLELSTSNNNNKSNNSNNYYYYNNNNNNNNTDNNNIKLIYSHVARGNGD